VLAPVVAARKGTHAELWDSLRSQGYTNAYVDGELLDLEEELELDKNFKHTIDVVIDSITLGEESPARVAEALEDALKLGDGVAHVLAESQAGNGSEKLTFSEELACPECGIGISELSPRSFSFNSPFGACQRCMGLGTTLEADADLLLNHELPLEDPGSITVGGFSSDSYSRQLILSVAEHYGIRSDVPIGRLPEKHRRIIIEGSGEEELTFSFHDYESDRHYRFRRPYEGLAPLIQRRFLETQSENMREYYNRYLMEAPCPDCGGKRLKPEILAVTVGDVNIADLAAMSIENAVAFFSEVEPSLSKREIIIAEGILKEIRGRLEFLQKVGLSYLTLDRKAASLSGGEAQRIRLATQIGSQLVGVLYILDEPTIGLHQRDNKKLISTLESLRDLGNTVLVVEHDREMMERADYIIDMGPGAGMSGGYVVATGTIEDIKNVTESLTGQYLSGACEIPIPEQRRIGNGKRLVVRGAGEHNLKSIDVEFPLGTFTCVTGVSGSGKSTLVDEVLYRAMARKLYRSPERPGKHIAIEGMEHVDKIIVIDQQPIGRTPRSNPATYTGAFTPIRELFSSLPESRARGYKPGRFSFNVKGGRCEVCEGGGIIRLEMHFLPDVYVPCEECKGKRFNNETLEIRYRGKNISEVLNMTIEEALSFFSAIPKIKRKLQTLFDVGLGYIELGQSATTLSGGEAQRVKLSTELSKIATGRTLYILDEPTTGLHFDDIRKLLEVLSRLVEKGNTVLVIEHNLDVIKCADNIIDLGPEGGDAGGEVVATGTPEDVARVEGSYTGEYLKSVLDGK
jgi:excinuclease ABC subunit A